MGDILRKTEVSFVCKVGNSFLFFLMECKNFSTKSKYSILTIFLVLVLVNQNNIVA